MLIFGHIGLTTLVIKACETLSAANRPVGSLEASRESWFKSAIFKIGTSLQPLLSKTRSRIGTVDYRLVIVCSLLPDIIDKPLWFFSAGGILPSGYGFGHTFLFNLVLFVSGLILVKYGKSWLFIISVSSFLHLIEDEIWNTPTTLWWPLLGPLRGLETEGWISSLLSKLLSEPKVYIPELIGLIVVLSLVVRLVKRKRFGNFTRTGAID